MVEKCTSTLPPGYAITNGRCLLDRRIFQDGFPPENLSYRLCTDSTRPPDCQVFEDQRSPEKQEVQEAS